MYIRQKKGFTLIELLVVIAIIGLLSSVVLASLNAARTKGKDAAVKSSMSTFRSAAEIYYSNNSTRYETVDKNDTACPGAGVANGTNVFVDTTSNGYTQQKGAITAGATSALCTSAAGGYVFSATLPGGTKWCVDGKGHSGVPTADPVADAVACPGL